MPQITPLTAFYIKRPFAVTDILYITPKVLRTRLGSLYIGFTVSYLPRGPDVFILYTKGRLIGPYYSVP